VWEEDILNGFDDSLPFIALSEDDDVWRWNLEEDGCFTVNSTYALLGSIFSPDTIFGANELRVFNNIWKG
jgi:hypothetical protein